MKILGIIIHRVPIAKIDIKSLNIFQYLIMQNTDAFLNINIRWFGWLIALKVDKMEASLIFKLDGAKTANKIIDKGIVIEFGMHRYVL